MCSRGGEIRNTRIGKFWRNKSVPNHAAVFEGLKSFFSVSLLALGMCSTVVPHSLYDLRLTNQAPI